MDELKQWMRDNNVHQISLMCGKFTVVAGSWRGHGDTPEDALQDAMNAQAKVAELLA